MNAAHHPAHAAAVPMGSGAGIGKVGPYNEMGNFYGGGAVQGIWFSWYYGLGYKYRPSWPADLTREQMIAIGKFWNMQPEMMPPSGLDGGANSLLGNGRLTITKPAKAAADAFVYDPMHPLPAAFNPRGSFDQTATEMRNDVLVYTAAPLTERVDVTGNIEVELYVSSDRKDTDFTIKLVDVGPDGKAFNLDDGILRARWREGWDKPVYMETGKVHKLPIPPLVTSNVFAAGHRIRVEVSSSAFPHFDRNLNTGGNNYDEKDWLVARNVVHHAPAYLSRMVLPIVKASSSTGSQ